MKLKYDKPEMERRVLEVKATKEQEEMVKDIRKWDWNEILTALCIIIFAILNIVDYIETKNIDYIGMMIFSSIFAFDYITSIKKIKEQHAIINLLCENLWQEREADKNESENNQE